jgi:hypothetical protein
VRIGKDLLRLWSSRWRNVDGRIKALGLVDGGRGAGWFGDSGLVTEGEGGLGAVGGGSTARRHRACGL